ncbi:hypothetical protein LINGRAPRIM_LOCUS309 [Linum grandiflorum]
MNVLAWNCRGIGPPLTENHLRRLVRRLRLAVIFLMETKHGEVHMEGKRATLDYANGFYVNPIATAGGLCLWWIANLDITVFHSSPNFVHVVVHGSSRFLCTFVHAPTDINER